MIVLKGIFTNYNRYLSVFASGIVSLWGPGSGFWPFRKPDKIYFVARWKKKRGGRQSNDYQISGIRNGQNPDSGPQSDTIPEATTDK